jgi:hypothetical protein
MLFDQHPRGKLRKEILFTMKRLTGAPSIFLHASRWQPQILPMEMGVTIALRPGTALRPRVARQRDHTENLMEGDDPPAGKKPAECLKP